MAEGRQSLLVGEESFISRVVGDYLNSMPVALALHYHVRLAAKEAPFVAMRMHDHVTMGIRTPMGIRNRYWACL